jgi:hypothetical protein
MNKKIVFNYRLAQDNGEKKGPKSIIVPQPAGDQIPILSLEGQKDAFEILELEAKNFRKNSPEFAKSDFFATHELSFQYNQLNPSQRRQIDNILDGLSTGRSNSTGSGFNNAKSQAKSYEPYLQKINDSTDGNNLLYLAAISSFGFPKIPGEDVKRLYTEKNEERIKSRLYQITSNHYIQTKFPNIPRQLSDAIQRLEKKVKGSSSTVSSGESSNGSSKPTTDTVPTPGSGRPTNNPYPPSDIGEFPKTQPDTFNPDEDNFSNEAKTIIDQIKDLEKLADSSKDAFKEQWIGSYENILNQLQIATSNNKIDIPEDSYIKTKLTNLDNKWVEIFYPGGFKRVGRGTIIPLDVKDAKATLLEQIKINKDPEQVKKLANIFQKVYLNGKSTQDTELYSYLEEINKAILIRNAKDSDSENIPTISMSEYRK